MITAIVVAGLVQEVVEEACFGIAVVIGEDYRLGDWSLNRVVIVELEGLIAFVAVGRREFGLPMSMGLGSASARGARERVTYLFWLCVSDIKDFSASDN